MQIAGLTLKSTKDLARDKLFLSLWGKPKSGKTSMAVTLDALTQAESGKRSVIIACEQADGNGLDRAASLDIPTFVIEAKNDDPKTALTAYEQLAGLVRELKKADEFGGIIWDAATEAVRHILVPYVTLNFNPVKNKEAVALRHFGVLADKDYIYLAELLRQITLDLAIANERGKHVVITTGAREFRDQERNITKVGPDFPGRETPSMFESMVPQIAETTLRTTGVGDARKIEAFCEFTPDRIRVRADRRDKFPLGKLPADIPTLYDLYYKQKENK